MVPEDVKQWYLSREPQDKTDEIIVELIEEIQALKQELALANDRLENQEEALRNQHLY
jgi:hypothetical protein